MINFDNSSFYYDPFPHCVLNNFLDKAVYDQICYEYPDLDHFEKLENKQSENKFKKYRFANNSKNINTFNTFINTTKATKEFYNYLNSDKFFLSLNNFLLKNDIDLRLNSTNSTNIKTIIKNIFKKKQKIDFEFSSIPIQNGYIMPHTDGGNKLVGFVIPIINNNDKYDAEHLGTKIFKAKTDKYKFNFYNKTVPYEHTELVRELPFEKNQMSLHVKTFNSLHGVGPILNKGKDIGLLRKSISIFLLK